MVRYQVTLAYDGTQFCGFQRQRSDAPERTVQQVVEEALRSLGWDGKAILSAGRTDTGVHASGQVIAFDLEWRHSTQALQDALNANLPLDVSARAVQSARPDFHPRFDARARRYQYRIFCQEVRHPLWERYAWRVWPSVELNLLRVAARSLIGAHDFAAFGTPPRPGGSTVRVIYRAEWKPEGEYLIFDIIGNAFLYHMVRRLVHTLTSVGQARLSVEEFNRYLDNGLLNPVRGLAPAQGLVLVEVIYPPEADTLGQENINRNFGEG